MIFLNPQLIHYKNKKKQKKREKKKENTLSPFLGTVLYTLVSPHTVYILWGMSGQWLLQPLGPLKVKTQLGRAPEIQMKGPMRRC